MEATSESIEPWSRGKVQSKAKTYLKLQLQQKGENNWNKEIISEEGVTSKSIDKIHDRHELFRPYKKENFQSNFRSLKKAVDKNAAAVSFDQEAFDKESQKYKNELTLKKGYPKWDHPQNNAKKLLANDLKLNSNSNITPSDLQASRPEYGVYPKNVFRDRFYREQRKQVEHPFWVYRRNKQMRNKTAEDELKILIEEEKDSSETVLPDSIE